MSGQKQELNNLRQHGTFAGQESILDLSRRLGINILVTISSDVYNQDIMTLATRFLGFILVWTRVRVNIINHN